jgi:cation diffusion facilitator CzcD-associated flavoprotein CzcO
MAQDSVIIVGAGPYGLSAAAYLQKHQVPTHIFGKPMEFWRNMPAGMSLKSTWSSISISDPNHCYTFDYFCKVKRIAKIEPVPLSLFLRYCSWFQKLAVPNVDQTYIKSLRCDGKIFRVDLEDGRSMQAGRVFVATGLSAFAYRPDFADQLSPELVSHTQDRLDFAAWKDKHVAVVGSGQSAFETAAFLHEAGADVEVIARGPVTWINRRLYRYAGPAKRLFYPPSDVGPAGISWLVAFPLIFRHLPEEMRISIDTRSVRPAVAPWMRERIQGNIAITTHTEVNVAAEKGHQACLKLSDGATRQVDHVILATGYRPDVQKLEYIDPELRDQIQARHGYPFLNEWFESSVPGLHMAGSLAGYDFGPLCRHITGSGVPARQLTRLLTAERLN